MWSRLIIAACCVVCLGCGKVNEPARAVDSPPDTAKIVPLTPPPVANPVVPNFAAEPIPKPVEPLPVAPLPPPEPIKTEKRPRRTSIAAVPLLPITQDRVLDVLQSAKGGLRFVVNGQIDELHTYLAEDSAIGLSIKQPSKNGVESLLFHIPMADFIESVSVDGEISTVKLIEQTDMLVASVLAISKELHPTGGDIREKLTAAITKRMKEESPTHEFRSVAMTIRVMRVGDGEKTSVLVSIGPKD